MLREISDAPVYGFAADDDRFIAGEGGEGIDHSFSADITVEDGETISGDGWSVEVVHTPGHLADHMALASGNRLFSGDHVMGWATTLISPPSGDLTEFMASLDKLLARDEVTFYPGHGAPVTDPKRLIRHIRDHRLKREAEIIAELEQRPASPNDLTRSIYRHVAQELHPAAKRNVMAHLIALEKAGRVSSVGESTENAMFSLVG